MHSLRSCLILAIAASVAGLASPTAGLDKATLATNWLAQPELGGFYQAVVDGTYRDHGLDVTIQPGGPLVNNRSLLAFGRIEFLVGTNLLPPFDAVKQGIPTKVVAAFFQKDPQCLLAHPGQGYKTWQDLTQAPLLMGHSGRNSFFLWMKSAHGFKSANLRPYNHSLGPFLVDKRAVLQGYATAEPMRVQEATGEQPLVFLMADHGWNSYSTVLETRTELIEKNPDLVQRFVDASILGWRRYLDGVDAAATNARIKKDNPAMTDGQIEYSVAKMREWRLVDGDEASAKGIGAIDPERVAAFHQTAIETGLLAEGAIDPAASYTTEFVNRGLGSSKAD
ncbi:MAG: ABC transporter substrate-binding protein [Pirellulales bacterium]|nr:ABC transporter substrate-binding protein [Pirellulales bacterium]